VLSFLPSTVLAAIIALLVVLNTTFWCVPLYAGIVVKALVPDEDFRRHWTAWLYRIASAWSRCNDWVMRLAPPIEFEVSGLDDLRADRSYLLVANHQSWSDIVLMQHLLLGRAPYPRYFTKRELLKLPLIGFALWGLDFPLLRRHTAAEIAKNPSLRADDMETTRAACARYRGQAVTVVIFLEGTRFRPHKHAAQNSPYRHLLRPRAGGFAFALGAMGEQFDAVLDMTIVYPEGNGSFSDLLAGRVRRVFVDLRRRPLPPWLIDGDYLGDSKHRLAVQQWLGEIWAEKDQLIEQVLEEARARAGSARENR